MARVPTPGSLSAVTMLPHRPSSDLRARARALLDSAWHDDPGFCVPNPGVYPHQWLWDSCFHSVVWSSFGDRRAVIELRSALASQDRRSGFVPHLTYWTEPDRHADLWERTGTSRITQPPMYGHAIAEAVRAGLTIEADLIDRAVAGMRHLLEHRPRRNGLICVLHPWETGCDDSARWDDWCPGGYDRRRWWEVKGELVRALRSDEPGGVPVGSERFAVPSVGFNALVAWNLNELAATVALEPLERAAGPLIAALAGRWDEGRRTWTDADEGSGRARTLDALLPVLVDPRDEVFDDLLDPDAYGAPFGPRGMHAAEPAADPDGYWRGGSWPQLSYLLALAARRAARHDVADAIMVSLRKAVDMNGFAEYWNPVSGDGRGADPQTWSALAAVTV